MFGGGGKAFVGEAGDGGVSVMGEGGGEDSVGPAS